MELKDIVYIDFKPISSHAMLISEFAEVYEYKDNTKTNKLRGYKGEFVISEGEYMGIRFAVEFDKLPRAELMHKYSIEFDEEESSVYASKNKFGLQFKLVGLSLVEE
ncbi:hypothetical protein [Ralstonia pseudosolanacearum]